jgi:hypothetical protein
LSFLRQEAEGVYRLWKARQVADAASSFATAPVEEGRTRGETKRRRMEYVPQELRGRASAGGGGELPGVAIVPPEKAGKQAQKTAALLEHVVHRFKPGVFEEFMAMMG